MGVKVRSMAVPSPVVKVATIFLLSMLTISKEPDIRVPSGLRASKVPPMVLGPSKVDGHAATGAVITKRTGEDLALVGFPANQFSTVHSVLIDPVSVQHVVFGGFAPVHDSIGEVVAGNPPRAVRPIPRARVGWFVDLGQGGFDRGAEPFQIEVSEFAGNLVTFPLVHDVQRKPEVFAGGSIRPAPDGPNVRPDAVLVVIARGDHSVPQFDVFESGVVGGDSFVPFIDAVRFAEIGPEESDAFLEDVFGRFKFSRDIRIKKCANAASDFSSSMLVLTLASWAWTCGTKIVAINRKTAVRIM